MRSGTQDIDEGGNMRKAVVFRTAGDSELAQAIVDGMSVALPDSGELEATKAQRYIYCLYHRLVPARRWSWTVLARRGNVHVKDR